MDTSENYIKMCDYEEIQGVKEKFKCTYGMDFNEVFMNNATGKEIRRVWLPRQDQIQAMIFDKYGYGNIAYNQWMNFSSWLQYNMSITNRPPILDKTMEQLWLMYHMSEKHNKEWDGDRWMK